MNSVYLIQPMRFQILKRRSARRKIEDSACQTGGIHTRTIKEATVKRFHDDSHDQLRTHRADFMAAYNFARRLKTLSGLTP